MALRIAGAIGVTTSERCKLGFAQGHSGGGLASATTGVGTGGVHVRWGSRGAPAVVAILALVTAAAATHAASSAGRASVGEIAFTVRHGDMSDDSGWDIYLVRTDGRWISRKQTRLSERVPGLNEDAPVWSPDGRRVAYFGWVCPPVCSGWRGWVYTMKSDGTDRRRLAQSTAPPQWSPDGRWIAYAWDGIYVMHADGTGKKRLTSSRLDSFPVDSDPYWSADGTRLAFTRETRRGHDVYVVAAAGGRVRRVTRTQNSAIAGWAPGREIIFTREALSVPAGVFIVNVDGSGLRRVATTGLYDRPAVGGWSPDARLIVWSDLGSAANGVSIVRPADGSSRRLTRGADNSPVWGPDGREIAFARDHLPVGSGDGVWIVNADGSGTRVVAPATGIDEYFDTAWAPR